MQSSRGRANIYPLGPARLARSFNPRTVIEAGLGQDQYVEENSEDVARVPSGREDQVLGHHNSATVKRVVVQSALACRAGDIAKSKGYREMECLAWNDITMRLKPTVDGEISCEDSVSNGHQVITSHHVL